MRAIGSGFSHSARVQGSSTLKPVLVLPSFYGWATRLLCRWTPFCRLFPVSAYREKCRYECSCAHLRVDIRFQFSWVYTSEQSSGPDANCHRRSWTAVLLKTRLRAEHFSHNASASDVPSPHEGGPSFLSGCFWVMLVFDVLRVSRHGFLCISTWDLFCFPNPLRVIFLLFSPSGIPDTRYNTLGFCILLFSLYSFPWAILHVCSVWK